MNAATKDKRTGSRTGAGEVCLFRASECARSGLPLALLLGAALLALIMAIPAAAAHADEAGFVEDENGRAAYANVLTSGSDAQVQRIQVDVGQVVELEGSISGGWGDVNLVWETCTGSDAVALLYGADPSWLGWTTTLEQLVPGVLPEMNRAVKAGDSAQTIVASLEESGAGACRLTATDEVGFTVSETWVFDDGSIADAVLTTSAYGADLLADGADEVGFSTMALNETASGVGTGETSIVIRRVTEAIPEPGGTPAGGNGSWGSSGQPANLLDSIVQASGADVTSSANDAAAGSGKSMPQTFDPLGVAVVLVLSIASVAAIFGAIANSRRH